MKCSNNLKQLSLAMHNHHDTMGQFPAGQPLGYYSGNWYTDVGTRDGDRSCWFAKLLPYIEQTAMTSQVEALLAPTTAGSTVTAPFSTIKLQAALCPTDPNGPKTSSLGQGVHGNYVVCHGNGFATPTADPRGLQLNGTLYGMSKTTFGSVTDGSSNTALLSEILVRPDTGSHDVRGRIWNSIHACMSFSTMHPPNSTIGDNPQSYCVVAPKMPCGAGSNTDAFLLARSMHPAGVNTAMGDGSVRVTTNNINTAVWLAYGSRDGGEAQSE